MERSRRRPRETLSGTVYPLHPKDTKFLIRSQQDITLQERIIVAGSSLAIVGSVFWVPLLSRWAFCKWKTATNRRKRAFYGSIVLALALVCIGGPHRNPRFGEWIKVRKWSFLRAWVKFIAMEVIADQPHGVDIDLRKDKAIFAFLPHGIFPFAFAFGVVPEVATEALGFLRPVVATATKLFPLVRDFLTWIDCVDASKSSVEQALSKGDRIAVIPGGIAEIFEGYPKAGTHPDEEYAIVRQGFLRLAAKHGVPVVPIYCFGATKMLRRLQLPGLETISNFLRVSICLFYGVMGLPIPFRQRLSYVVGQPIHPPSGDVTEAVVDDMQQKFCSEVMRLFDRHKEAYGWSHKSLKLLTR